MSIMRKPANPALFLLLLNLFVFAGAAAAETVMPEITAQGFSADQPQDGVAGEYPRLRVRIEAPCRISELRIQERSYDVDLATTKDKYNLHLFGLNQSPRSHADVTLNLQRYINEKITSGGLYEFRLRVTDKRDNTAEGKISVRIHEALSPEDLARAEKARRLQTGTFALQRTGSGALQGADLFGIDWINIDSAKVAVRISAAASSDTRFALLKKSDYDAIRTTDQLDEKLEAVEWSETLVLDTAEDRAEGQVFLLRHEGMDYILKVTTSSATPSEPGTVVTLEGSYKHRKQAE
ncbi:MAG: hypothetical protein P8Z78_15185 [Gammaproteobacteria bacterium]